MTPKLNYDKNNLIRFISPFDSNNNIYATQEIYFNINKRHTLGLFFQSDRRAQISKNAIGLIY